MKLKQGLLAWALVGCSVGPAHYTGTLILTGPGALPAAMLQQSDGTRIRLLGLSRRQQTQWQQQRVVVSGRLQAHPATVPELDVDRIQPAP